MRYLHQGTRCITPQTYLGEFFRRGVHEKTVMKIGGWKTRSVFDRYNIVDKKDLADVAAKLDQKAQERKLRHSSGTVTSESCASDNSGSVN
jgi:hypothetical protein